MQEEKVTVSRVYAGFLVILGFAISVALVNITKWLYVEYHFKYPIWLTSTHMLMSLAASSLGLFGLPCIFGTSGGPCRLIPEEERVRLTLRQQVVIIAPFSICGALSLGAANFALIYLFFHAMLQNTTPIWAVLCAKLFQGKIFNWPAYGALLFAVGGGMICALSEKSDFEMIGLFISLSAAGFRAMKSVLQAELMRGNGLKLDSISLLYYSAPLNMVFFLLWSLVQEGLEPWTQFLVLPNSGKAWVLAAAFAAAAFNLIGFLTIGYLGAVVSLVVGNMKTPTTILVSSMVFGNPVSVNQMLGFAVGAFGVFLYDRYGKELRPSTFGRGGHVPLGSGTGRTGKEEIMGLKDDLEFGMDEGDDTPPNGEDAMNIIFPEELGGHGDGDEADFVQVGSSTREATSSTRAGAGSRQEVGQAAGRGEAKNIDRQSADGTTSATTASTSSANESSARAGTGNNNTFISTTTSPPNPKTTIGLIGLPPPGGNIRGARRP
ncbi:unnamed protein product [Amoebophrya sp. A25]|nr:unnamed protein product [Amoebophrya sp. A25]|eukprot:GSA25T00018038001.1